MNKVALVTAVVAGITAGFWLAEAQADTTASDQFAFCTSIADYAQAAADDRDAGYEASDLFQQLAESDLNDDQLEILAIETATVFSEPHLSPTNEGRLSFHNCLIAVTDGEWL